jgi:hypothetical protein
MLYAIFRVIVSLVLKLSLKRIHISGLENIHPDKPQILASNHPNGFIEPLVMACFFPRPLYFLVRGDVFENPLLKPILEATHQIPVFRFKDGFSNLRKNAGTIGTSVNVLVDRKALLIFVEGGTLSVKKLRPLQKGVARIASDAFSLSKVHDLEIVPVGINFTYPTAMASEVMLCAGTPIKVADYFSDAPGASNKSSSDQLLNEIHSRMSELVIHIEENQRLGLFEHAVQVIRMQDNSGWLPKLIAGKERLMKEYDLAAKINRMDEDTFEKAKDDFKKVFHTAKRMGFGEKDLIRKASGWIDFVMLIICIPLFALGFLTNYFPVLAAKGIRKKLVSHKEFILSIELVFSIIFFILYYIGIISVFILFNVSLLMVPVMISSGVLSLYLWHLYKERVWKNSDKFIKCKEEISLLYNTYFVD